MATQRGFPGGACAALAILLLFAALPAASQQARLGMVDFPTSGSPEAQAHFLRGVAALHSFWYEEALEEFRAATRAQPDFAMGYWGEAMTYNQPIWAEQDTEAGRQALGRMRGAEKVTLRERAYIDALRALYGPGDKQTRDLAYAAAMEKLHRDLPQDDEAACFYALALLGTVRPGERGFRRQMQAGAIVLDVFQRHPNHPGAAHYIIHSFDDPDHAILALPAARRYASIAPAAHHALHMPSHIFLQLGMWPETVASNEASWAASVEAAKRKGLSSSALSFHALTWLTYAYLQQGRFAKAEEMLALRYRALHEFGSEGASARPRAGAAAGHGGEMAAALVVETEQWQKAAELFSDPDPAALANREAILAAFIRGLAAAHTDPREAEKDIAVLRAYREKLTADHSYRAIVTEVMELEVMGAARAEQGRHEEAEQALRRATELEEKMDPPSGPPDPIKPSHELFGEILMRAGRPKDAAREFAWSLEREPNRARSLLGAARAASRSGDAAAAVAMYSKLLQVWEQADAKLVELREARDFLRQAGVAAQSGAMPLAGRSRAQRLP